MKRGVFNEHGSGEVHATMAEMGGGVGQPGVRDAGMRRLWSDALLCWDVPIKGFRSGARAFGGSRGKSLC